MDSAGYIGLTRQSGLMKELQTLAQNVANSSTVGYRREGLVFSEFIKRGEDKADSLSMATARARFIDTSQGVLKRTGGKFDAAIEGEGFFQIETANGVRLTRAGNFALNPDGELVTPEGQRVLSADGAAIALPPDARSITIAGDGEVAADGEPIASLGIVTADSKTLRREDGTLFEALKGTQPVENPRVAQGFLEQSNVDPVMEIARLVEVQRAYELGQGMLDREHDRITRLIQTVGRSA